MDPIAEGLLEVVRRELGYKEKANQYTKFGKWYSSSVQDPQYKNAPWCDMFLAWAADKAGVRDYVGQFAWTPSHANWFKKQGAWSETPEPGALVFYDWSGSRDTKKIDHVGIVEKVENGKLHTIEANVDKVWLKRKVRDESKVVGYGVPRKVLESRVQLGTAGPGDSAWQVKAPAAGAAPARLNAAAMQVGEDSAFAVFGADGIAAAATGLTVLVFGSVLVMSRASARRRAAVPHGRHRRRAGRDHVM